PRSCCLTAAPRACSATTWCARSARSSAWSTASRSRRRSSSACPRRRTSYAARFYGLGPAETRVRIPRILERVGFPGARARAPLRRALAGGRVPRGHRPSARGGSARGGGVMRAQSIAMLGVVERNAYLVKRYGWWELAFFAWTVANTLTVVFIADGVQASGGTLDVERQTTILLIGAVLWAYLGIVFEILTETVAWERWEGTIEYTFMAPLSRAVHLGGMGAFAVLYGVLRTALLFVVVALFFGLHLQDADFLTASVLLAVAWVS